MHFLNCRTCSADAVHAYVTDFLQDQRQLLSAYLVQLKGKFRKMLSRHGMSMSLFTQTKLFSRPVANLHGRGRHVGNPLQS